MRAYISSFRGPFGTMQVGFDTPAHLAKGEVNYDDGRFFGNLAGAYTSQRNVTYTGDVKIDGYVLCDAALGYRFPEGAAVGGVEVQVNAVNLLDKNYIAGVRSLLQHRHFAEQHLAGRVSAASVWNHPQAVLKGTPTRRTMG